MRCRSAAWAATWLGLTTLSLWGFAPPASATITIVGVDQGSGEVGAVGSSCAPADFAATAVLVPGVGAATLLGPSDERAAGNLLRKLDEGDAEGVLRKAGGLDPNATHRYAIAVLPPSTAVGGSGAAPPIARAGRRTIAAAQGERLQDPGAVRRALRAFQASHGPLAGRLLNALEAGNSGGGDRRCGRQRASSAFLIVAGPLGSVVIPARGLDAVVQRQRRVRETLGGQLAADEMAVRLLVAAALPGPEGPGKPPVYLSLLQPRGGFDAVALLRKAYDVTTAPTTAGGVGAAPSVTPPPDVTDRSQGSAHRRSGPAGFTTVLVAAVVGAIAVALSRRSRSRAPDADET